MSSAPLLETFSVFISPEHCPALPPSPATTHRAVSRSPSASPLQHTRRLSVSVGAAPELFNEEKLGSNRMSATISETGIHLREVRKFVRRSPALREITWYGRHGIQGQWNITRAFTNTQSGTNLIVEYAPCAALSDDVYNRFQREEEAVKVGWSPGSVEREASDWTGPNAELYNSLRAAERDSEEKQVKEEKATRLASRKNGLSGLSMEMPKQSLKTSTSNSTDGQATQFPSPVSPVEPKTLLSPRKSAPRERRHTSASLSSRSNGDEFHSNSASFQQPRVKSQPDVSTGGSKGPTTQGRGRATSKRGAYAGSDGRPRAETNGGGSRRPNYAPESTSTGSRGGNSRGGKSTRGSRGTNGRARRTEL